MNGVFTHEQGCSEFVEFDPTGRYGRYNEILGKGASKTVYRAFDEYEGIEVAWNQVKLHDFLQRPEDLERLYSEIHLLKTLKHTNIMKFYTSWVDAANRNINFVTEMFTSGTLRQYRLKHKRINIRAVKNWCGQILKGLVYLHSLDPPVIHRDLKCDNIFINGNQGQVKIGDLGLAAILCKSHAVRCVGTPEFMAPEVYAEEYNELVDIYSFGMCILEMVTFEYPYSECTHPAQIYKKVVSGKKPNALYKVRDPEVQQFIEKCLAPASCRLPAKELLKDQFLQIDDYGYDLGAIEYSRDFGPFLRQPLLRNHHSSSSNSLINGCSSNYLSYETWNDLNYRPEDFDLNENDLHEEQHLANVDITINGSWTEDDGIFLRLRIADKEGRVRNIYFHFDIETDTALSVATEMVAELDMTDQEVTKIADMIDREITALVPNWKMGLGRFEEITYQLEGSEQCVTEGAPAASSSQSDGIQYDELCSEGSLRDIHSDDELEEQSNLEKGERDVNKYKKMIRKELDWLKRKYQMQQTEVRDQQLEMVRRSSSLTLGNDNGFPLSSFSTPPMESCREDLLKSLTSNAEEKSANQRAWNCEAPYGSCYRSEQVTTAKSFYAEALLPHSLLKTTSLPVDF